MKNHVADGDDYVRYWVEYRKEWHRCSIVVRVDKFTDSITANIFVRGDCVATAAWEQCDSLRSVKFTTIGKRYAWLCDVMREKYGFIVPMEV